MKYKIWKDKYFPVFSHCPECRTRELPCRVPPGTGVISLCSVCWTHQPAALSHFSCQISVAASQCPCPRWSSVAGQRRAPSPPHCRAEARNHITLSLKGRRGAIICSYREMLFRCSMYYRSVVLSIIVATPSCA